MRKQIVVPGNLAPKGYQQITDLSSAVGLTVPEGALFAKVVAESQDVRWRDDGTSPTANVGMPIDVDVDPEEWFDADLDALEFIETTSGGTLNVSYYGYTGQ